MDLIAFRQPTEADLSFVYSSWLKSYRTSDASRRMVNDVYYGGHKRVIARLLSTSLAIVAVNPEDPDQIYGYIVYAEAAGVPVVHYVYVKQPYRRHGIASQLFALVRKSYPQTGDLPALATHATDYYDKLRDKWNLLYNPYVVEKVAG